MSQKAANRRYAYWAIALPISVVLLFPAYRSWVRASEAKSEVAAAKMEEDRVHKEHTKWAELAKEHEGLRKALFKEKQDLTSAIKSFSRDELHPALKRAVEGADLRHAIVFETSSLLWGSRAWVWVPEPEHQLAVQITATNLEPSEVVGAAFQDQDLKIDLAPKKLHMVQFWIEERNKSKDAVLRLRFNDEMLIEKTMLLDPNSSTSNSGSSGDVFSRPRVISNGWVWHDDAADLFQRGMWHVLDRRTFGLRPRSAAQNDTRQVKIKCTMGIASSQPIYATKSSKFRLPKLGLEFTEVEDADSEYHGLLQITGVKPDESTP